MVRPSARCRRNSSRCGEMSLHRGRAVSTTACKRERERERERSCLTLKIKQQQRPAAPEASAAFRNFHFVTFHVPREA